MRYHPFICKQIIHEWIYSIGIGISNGKFRSDPLDSLPVLNLVNLIFRSDPLQSNAETQTERSFALTACIFIYPVISFILTPGTMGSGLLHPFHILYSAMYRHLSEVEQG